MTGTIALFLTIAMFATKEIMLGFPALMFWAVFGGYAYTLSIATWDPYYFVFFAAMGMVIFMALATFAMRARTATPEEDEFIDEGEDVPGGSFIDEGSKPSKRSQAVRDRAKKRRKRLSIKNEDNW